MDYDPTIPRLEGWHSKPEELETRSQWKQRYDRQVLRGQKPNAILILSVQRKAFTGDTPIDGMPKAPPVTVTRYKEVPLYCFEQTKPYKPSARTLAIRSLARLFLWHSSRDFYIWITEDGWVSCHGKLSFNRFETHIRQEEMYGVRSAGRWTQYGGIDLDLHEGDPDIFLEQLAVLQDEFHGHDGWHYQVADERARGVHLIQVLHARQSYIEYRTWLRGKLTALDDKYPDLAQRTVAAGMNPFSTMEIFPNVGDGLRLIFSKGRTMLTDRPLTKIQYRGKSVVDVEMYMAWVNKPKQYMPRQEVFDYISSRIAARSTTPPDTSSSATPDDNGNKQKPKAKAGERSSTRNQAGLRKHYAQDIQEFWSGTNTPPDSLNRGILLLANMAPYYFDNRECACIAMERMIDDLPDISFSDRLLTGEREKVSRVVSYSMNRAFENYASQDIERQASRLKLKETHRTWARKGFNPFDKTTWNVTAGVINLGPDFEWENNENERLGEIAAILKTDIDTTTRFVKYIVRLIAGHDGELSMTFICKSMKAYNIRLGSKRDNKSGKMMALLREWNWIFVRAEKRWFPRQENGTQSKGQARSYGIGHGLRHKFDHGIRSIQEKKPLEPLLLRYHAEYHQFTAAELHQLALEYARLRSKESDVQPLTHEDRESLAAVLQP